jgi:hypothetical protein
MVIKNIGTTLELSLKDLENIDEPINDDEIWTINEDEFKKFDPETKEMFIREEIRFAIRKYGSDGLTVDELVQIINHDKKTIKKHLDLLIGLREVYSQKKNKRLVLYYPNGKPLHSVNKKILEMGNTYFEISLASGPRDKLFFHILEKRVSLLDNDKAEGAILVPLGNLDEFINILKEIQKDAEWIKDEYA